MRPPDRQWNHRRARSGPRPALRYGRWARRVVEANRPRGSRRAGDGLPRRARRAASLSAPGPPGGGAGRGGARTAARRAVAMATTGRLAGGPSPDRPGDHPEGQLDLGGSVTASAGPPCIRRPAPLRSHPADRRDATSAGRAGRPAATRGAAPRLPFSRRGAAVRPARVAPTPGVPTPSPVPRLSTADRSAELSASCRPGGSQAELEAVRPFDAPMAPLSRHWTWLDDGPAHRMISRDWRPATPTMASGGKGPPTG